MAHMSFFKETSSRQVERRTKARKAKAIEDQHKAEVRRRDKRCRFPLCGCRKLALSLEVSHRRHKGMGGNPGGDRSLPDGLIYLCRARHQELKIAIDRGTLEWRPLTTDGANGPVSWHVDAEALHLSPALAVDGWIEVAREIRNGVCEPLSPFQRSILLMLAEMTT
jgi:hypothetical protein